MKNLRNLLPLLLLLFSVSMNAQKTMKPKVSFVTDKTVKVQSVEVTDTETILDITSEGDWWQLNSQTKLFYPNVENQVCSLAVKRVESGGQFCKFDTQYEAPNRAIRLKIHFPRLPAGVDHINMSEPGGWGIIGISIKTTTSAPVTAATQKSGGTPSAQGNASSAQSGKSTTSAPTQSSAATTTTQATTTPARVQATSMASDSQGHGYVNMGLPSGTLWATMNIGASKPEEAGSYFAWGETKPKQNYTWQTYKFWKKNPDATKYVVSEAFKDIVTKYNTRDYRGPVDNLRQLQPADDAATQNWGTPWHTPTIKQWEELVEECTFEEQKLPNGKWVVKVTGPNKKFIYLPCASFMEKNALWTSGFNLGAPQTCYWSADLKDDPLYGKVVWFVAGMPGYNEQTRYTGLPVRPVCQTPPAAAKSTNGQEVKPVAQKVANEETAFLDGMAQTNWAAKVDAARKLMYRRMPDYAKAITLLTEAAEHGDTNAQWMLAQLYLEGTYTDRNLTKAWHYAEQASSAGNPIGTYWLAVLYDRGEGSPIKDAKERYQRAQALFMDAKTGLLREAAGQPAPGLNRDYTELRKVDVYETIARFLEVNDDEGQMAMTKEYFEKAEEAGSRYAQLRMGDWYMTGSFDLFANVYDRTVDGENLPEQGNYLAAVNHYQKAADQGDADAQNMVGVLFVQKGGAVSRTPRDNYYLTKVFKHFSDSAQQGNIDALYNLGYCYENGYGCAKDKNKAVSLYQQAAGSGHKKAEEHLAEMR